MSLCVRAILVVVPAHFHPSFQCFTHALTRFARDPNARECPVLYPNPANHVKFPHFDTDVLLLQASSSSDPADVELFLRRDGNPNVHDLLGVSALHRAAMMNDVATINVLIQYGANIEQQDVDGWTPLFAAVHFGSTAGTS